LVKLSSEAGHWWLTSIIIATQRSEGLQFEASPGQNNSQDPISKRPITKKGWQSGSSGKDCLPSKHETLSWNSCATHTHTQNLQWNHVALGFSLLSFLIVIAITTFSISLLVFYLFRFFFHDSVLVGCMFLGIYPFLLGYPNLCVQLFMVIFYNCFISAGSVVMCILFISIN
jgi:hypothetical protein